MEILKLYRATEAQLQQLTKIYSGYAYFCVDSGNLYIDINNERILINRDTHKAAMTALEVLQGSLSDCATSVEDIANRITAVETWKNSLQNAEGVEF